MKNLLLCLTLSLGLMSQSVSVQAQIPAPLPVFYEYGENYLARAGLKPTLDNLRKAIAPQGDISVMVFETESEDYLWVDYIDNTDGKILLLVPLEKLKSLKTEFDYQDTAIYVSCLIEGLKKAEDIWNRIHEKEKREAKECFEAKSKKRKF